MNLFRSLTFLFTLSGIYKAIPSSTRKEYINNNKYGLQWVNMWLKIYILFNLWTDNHLYLSLRLLVNKEVGLSRYTIYLNGALTVGCGRLPAWGALTVGCEQLQPDWSRIYLEPTARYQTNMSATEWQNCQCWCPVKHKWILYSHLNYLLYWQSEGGHICTCHGANIMVREQLLGHFSPSTFM